MSTVLHTPDERFANLPGFDFAPHYRDAPEPFPGVRLHYLDEPPSVAGDSESAPAPRGTMLCLHGHPTWCYLYRRMVPILTARGYRVVAPDLPGFGRSDKPAAEDAYTYAALRQTLIAFIEALDLTDVTLVMHDWGAVLGLTLPMVMPERVSGLVVMNTTLPTGDKRLPDGVLGWRTFNDDNPDLNIPALMAKANRILSIGECRAYGAPFADATFKAGVRALPRLIAQAMDDPAAETARAARRFLAEEWQGASHMVVGARDPLHSHAIMRHLHRFVRGCPPETFLFHAGHFVPEWGDEFAGPVLDSLEAQQIAKARAAAEAAEPDAPG